MSGSGYIRRPKALVPDRPGSGAPAVKNYITPSGHRRLTEELNRLWKVERPKLVETVAWAAANGDRSENGDYLYGKRRLREIDRRVRFLRKRLYGLVVVARPPDDRSRVYFGAWVRLEDEAGEQTELRIVGPDEIDPARRHVSMDSPLARALMRRRVDDEFSVELPGGRRTYVVTAIRYEEE